LVCHKIGGKGGSREKLRRERGFREENGGEGGSKGGKLVNT